LLAHDNDRRANNDTPLLFRQALNLSAVAMLLHGCPEVATTEERRVH
jgi:hypothetical protein